MRLNIFLGVVVVVITPISCSEPSNTNPHATQSQYNTPKQDCSDDDCPDEVVTEAYEASLRELDLDPSNHDDVLRLGVDRKLYTKAYEGIIKRLAPHTPLKQPPKLRTQPLQHKGCGDDPLDCYCDAVAYCGPGFDADNGNGQIDGISISDISHHPGTCLNEVCFQHDRCYRAIDESCDPQLTPCVWSDVTSVCDKTMLRRGKACRSEPDCGLECEAVLVLARGLELASRRPILREGASLNTLCTARFGGCQHEANFPPAPPSCEEMRTNTICEERRLECGHTRGPYGDALNCGDCQAPLNCRQGQCLPPCPDDACPRLGDNRCIAGTMEVCGYHESDTCLSWGGGFVCAYGCDGQSCAPCARSCQQINRECGEGEDRCGGVLNCGSCTNREECSRDGQCLPIPDCTTDAQCGAPLYGEWSACSADDTCSVSGVQIRTAENSRCVAQTCHIVPFEERRVCARNPQGSPCGENAECRDGACVEFGDEGCPTADDCPATACRAPSEPVSRGIIDHQSVAWSGQEYGILWTINDRLFFQRLSAQGELLGSRTRITRSSGGNSTLTWTGDSYAVLWEDHHNGEMPGSILLAELDPQGEQQWRTTVTDEISTVQGLSMVRTNANFAVVWSSQSQGLRNNIFFATLSHQGVKQTDNILLSESETHLSLRPNIAWDGTTYAVVWAYAEEGMADYRFAALSQNGDVLAYETIVPSRYTNVASLVWTGEEFALAWDDNGGIGGADAKEIYVVRFNAQGQRIGDIQRITHMDGDSEKPTLVWNGNGYGVFWVDNADSSFIYFQTLNSNAIPTGPMKRFNVLGYHAELASSIWNGSGYGVLWTNDRDVYFADTTTRCE